MRFNRLLMVVSAFLLGSFAISGGLVARSQTAPTAAYDPRLTFAPLTLPDPVNVYRSSNGAPGPAYWQNEADYEMHAALDTTAKILRNDELITYTNNSPDALTSLWIHMEQNSYRKDARTRVANGESRPKKPVPDDEDNPNGHTTEGFVLDSVEIERGKEVQKAEYLVDDTRMQIRLSAAVGAQGQRAQDSTSSITIRYRECGAAGLRGEHRSTERSTTLRSGIRACVFTTIFADGTRCPISAVSSTSSMATLTIT